MNNFINAEINDFNQKENGYLALFCIRLGNFNVKADAQAMIPVTVSLSDSDYNFEDVASATRPNDYTFDVTPKNENNTQAIIQGVAEMHPEFKVAVKLKEYSDGSKEKHIIYTMPDVTKERRDLLNEMCKTCYDECLAKLEMTYTKRLADTAQLLLKMPEDADNARKAFKKTYNDAKENAEKLLNAKLKEIEEGYQRYLQGKDNIWENSYENDPAFDYINEAEDIDA